jgi:hypothetical protein
VWFGAREILERGVLVPAAFISINIAPHPEGIINQGQGNQTARAIQVRQGETLNKQAFIELIQAVAGFEPD